MHCSYEDLWPTSPVSPNSRVTYTALRYQYRQTRVLGTTVFIPEIADFIEVALTSCPLNCSYFLVNGHLIERLFVSCRYQFNFFL